MNISELGRRHGLSRSTLLYYDRIGLLRPSARSAAGYRRYGAADEERLQKICTFRRAGMTLEEIGRILDAPKGRVADALRRRLEELDGEMDALRQQQRVIARLLKSGRVPAGPAAMDKATWGSLLAASGFSEDDMNRWHVELERSSPAEHGQFLGFLGIPEDEAAAIRRRCRAAGPGSTEGRGSPRT
jgi:DNA-binding transcriptional MerR regulator